MSAIAWAPIDLVFRRTDHQDRRDRHCARQPATLLLHRRAAAHHRDAVLSLVIFFLIGSPFVRGRRAKVQAEANKVISERSAEIPDLPQGADIPVGVDSMFRLNRNLSSLPCVTGVSHGLFGEAVADEYRAVSRQLNLAEWRQRPKGQRYVDNVMRLV